MKYKRIFVFALSVMLLFTMTPGWAFADGMKAAGTDGKAAVEEKTQAKAGSKSENADSKDSGKSESPDSKDSAKSESSDAKDNAKSDPKEDKADPVKETASGGNDSGGSSDADKPETGGDNAAGEEGSEGDTDPDAEGRNDGDNGADGDVNPGNADGNKADENGGNDVNADTERNADTEQKAEPDVDADENKDGGDKDKEDTYPAQNFQASTSELKIRISAPKGVFPENTSMKVKPVSGKTLLNAVNRGNDSNQEAVSAVAADITFHKNGREIQPKDDLTVRLTSLKKLEGESYKAVTMKDSGAVQTVGSATASSSVFSTDHFTVYGIIGEEETEADYEDDDVVQFARCTYEFYAGDPSTDPASWPKVAEQIYRDGDVIETLPEPKGNSKALFQGWFKASLNGDQINYGDEVTSGDMVVIDPAVKDKGQDAGAAGGGENGKAVNKILRVYAKYSEQFKVTLYKDENGTAVFDTILAKDGETVALPSAEQAQANGLLTPDSVKMTGWKYPGSDSDSVIENQVTINGADIELVPAFANVYLVTFDTMGKGGRDVESQSVEEGKTAMNPDAFNIGETYDDNRFRFEGWYEGYDAATQQFSAEPFDFDTPITKDMVLHAKWTPLKKEYKIRIFYEKAVQEDNQYVLKKSIQVGPDHQWAADIEGRISPAVIKGIIEENGATGLHINGSGSTKHNIPKDKSDYDRNGVIAAAVLLNGSEAGAIWDKNGTQQGDGTIRPDGSSVLNVYYSRDTFWMKFRKFGTTGDGLSDQVADPNGGYMKGCLIKYGENLYERLYLGNAAFRHYIDTKGQVWWARWKDQAVGSKWEMVPTESNQVRFDFNATGLYGNLKDGSDVRMELQEFAQKERTYINYYQNLPSDESVYEAKKLDNDVVRDGITYNSSKTSTNFREQYSTLTVTMGRPENGFTAIATDNAKRYEDTESGTTTVRKHWYKDDEKEPIYIYYIRNQYAITFVPNDGNASFSGTVNDETKIYYRENISQAAQTGKAKDYVIGKTLATRNGQVCVFQGWYDNAACEGKPYQFDRMPANNLTLYGKWVPAPCRVVFHPMNPGMDDNTVVREIAVGSKVAKIARPAFGNRIFLGWHIGYDEETKTYGDPFDFNTAIKTDLLDEENCLHLYGAWDNGDTFRVKYLQGDHGTLAGADGGAVMDPAEYSMQASAPVRFTPTPEKGYVFAGWQIGGEGKVYGGSGDDSGRAPIRYSEDNDAAGAAPEAEKNDGIVVLVALYAKQEDTTEVIYHANYPAAAGNAPARTLTEYTVNGAFIVKDPDDQEIGFGKEYTAPEGTRYRFAGWTNTSGERIFSDSDAREYFYPGEMAAAGKLNNAKSPGKNELWAVWIKVEEQPDNPVSDKPAPDKPDPNVPVLPDPTDHPEVTTIPVTPDPEQDSMLDVRDDEKDLPESRKDDKPENDTAVNTEQNTDSNGRDGVVTVSADGQKKTAAAGTTGTPSTGENSLMPFMALVSFLSLISMAILLLRRRQEKRPQ